MEWSLPRRSRARIRALLSSIIILGSASAVMAQCEPGWHQPPSGALPDATLGVFYTSPEFSNLSYGPGYWAIGGDGLPPGLVWSEYPMGIGTISGVPILVGTWNFTASYSSNCGTSVGVYSLTVVPPSGCPTITIDPPTIPEPVLGVPYSQQLVASGGAPPYTFTLPSSALPPGLTLSTSGLISGTATRGGIYEVSVIATDRDGCAAGRDYYMVLACTPVGVATERLPDATVGVYYRESVVGDGGTPPYAFDEGPMPPGLILMDDGRVVGTPTTPGYYEFDVDIVDAHLCRGTATMGLLVECYFNEITMSPDTLAAGEVDAWYQVLLQASGGNPPHRFAVVAGALPVGFVLSSWGVLSGVTQTQGSYAFTILATDDRGCPGSIDYTLAISCPTIALDPPTLPDGSAGIPYAASLSASGGSTPYLYDVPGFSLPPGLALDPSTGSISGTCPVPGVWTFTARATDSRGCAGTRAYTIDMAGAGELLAGEALSDTRVQILDAAGGAAATFRAYAGGAGTRVAAGDLDLDTFDEVVTGVGSGGPHVRAFLRDGTPVAKVSFYAYGTLTGGVKVAAGSLDLDAHAELVTGPGPTEAFGPHVRGWNYDATAVTPIGKVSFYAYQTLKYGVNVAASDLDGDAFRELATTPGPGLPFGAQVKGWNVDGGAVTPLSGMNFVAFASSSFGAEVAVADVSEDGATIAAARGPGPANAAEVTAFRYDGGAVGAIPGFQTTPFATLFGARVALGELGGIAGEELACGAGPDPAADASVAAYSFDGTGMVPLPGFPVVSFPSLGGVNVGAALAGY